MLKTVNSSIVEFQVITLLGSRYKPANRLLPSVRTNERTPLIPLFTTHIGYNPSFSPFLVLGTGNSRAGVKDLCVRFLSLPPPIHRPPCLPPSPQTHKHTPRACSKVLCRAYIMVGCLTMRLF